MRLSDLDGWLFDRVFEPLCERLDRFGTCFDLARGLGVGIIVFNVASQAVDPYQSALAVAAETAGTALQIFAVLLIFRLVHKVESSLADNTMNPLRTQVTASFYRKAYGLYGFACGTVFLFFQHLEAYSLLLGLVCWMWFVFAYLIACTPRLPSHKASHVPKIAVASPIGV